MARLIRAAGAAAQASLERKQLAGLFGVTLFVDGVNIYRGEKPKKPEWYAVRVVRNDVDRRICCSIDQGLKLAACRDYHWTPAVPTAIWQSREPSDDSSCL